MPIALEEAISQGDIAIHIRNRQTTQYLGERNNMVRIVEFFIRKHKILGSRQLDLRIVVQFAEILSGRNVQLEMGMVKQRSPALLTRRPRISTDGFDILVRPRAQG